MSRGAGSAKQQAEQKALRLARAQQDPLYSRAVFGVWPPPATGTPVQPAQTQSAQPKPQAAPAAPRRPRLKGRARAVALDTSYRRALGLQDGEPIPAEIGQIPASDAVIPGGDATKEPSRDAEEAGAAQRQARERIKEGPKRRRKLYAWERGLVASSLPPEVVPRNCKGCRTEHPTKALRYGYCPRCWEQSPQQPGR